MKRGVALVALGAAIVLAGVGCGGSTSALGHFRILLLGHGLTGHGVGEARIFLWRSGSPAKPLTRGDYYACPTWLCFSGISEGFWSPDGRSIAYEKNFDGGTVPPYPTIFVMRSDGTHVKPLSDPPDSEQLAGPPSWSPDGRQIVFKRDLEGYYGVASEDFAIVDVRSKHQRTLDRRILHTNGRTFGGAVTGDPVWGRPGIAYSSRSGIMLLNPTTGRSRLVTRRYRSGTLAWSPAGVLAAVEPTEIVLLAASGRVLGKLPLPSATRACAIAWSPNGKQILAASDSKGNLRLWLGTVSMKHWQSLPTAPTWRNYKYDCAVSWR